jgi:hypothetical protein
MTGSPRRVWGVGLFTKGGGEKSVTVRWLSEFKADKCGESVGYTRAIDGG